MPRALATLALLATSPALAATYPVGAARAYPTLASLPVLAPGDVVEIDAGTYHEVKRWTDAGSAAAPIVIRGVGATRPIVDATGKTVDGVLPNPRAVFQIEAGYVTVENVELVGARNGSNGAGVRVTGAAANHVVLRNLKIDGNDMGVMSDGNDELVVESCEIAGNGTAMFSGYSHNLYLGGNKTTIRSSYIHDSLYGQNVKSRGHYTELLYNFIANSQDGEVGLVDAAETATANSNALLIGNVVVSKPRQSGWNSGRFVWFGQDGGGAHNGTLYAINNTFVAGDGRIYFLDSNSAGASVVASNNAFFGSDTIVNGGPSSGSNNWVASSATVPPGFSATVKGAAPGFADAVNRDLHLLSSSPCRDAALAMPTFVDGNGARQPGVPTLEYVVDLRATLRLDDGTLDIGAYEFGSVAPALDLAGGVAPDLGGVAPDLGGAHGGRNGCGCAVGGAPSALGAPLALVALALAAAAAAAARARRSGRARASVALSAAILWVATAAQASPPTPWSRVRTPTAGPARAIGGYSAGCIEGAVALPTSGPGFRVARPERGRVFGHPGLIGLIRELGARVRSLHLEAISVGDLGQPRGGPAPTGHASHQTGLDVDIWFLPPVGKRTASLVDAATQRASDRFTDGVARQLELVASDPRVDRLFVNPALKRALCQRSDGGGARQWLRKVRPWWGHDDHFHVRLACPSDSPECVAQAPLPPGDGCDGLDWWFNPAAQAERKQEHQTYSSRVGATPELPERCNALVADPARSPAP